MPALHTFNKSKTDTNLMQSCCDALASDDVLLLIEDGVYNATFPLQASLQSRIDSGLKVYVRALDVNARGIKTQVLPGMLLVEDREWVELCVKHQPLVSWY